MVVLSCSRVLASTSQGTISHACSYGIVFANVQPEADGQYMFECSSYDTNLKIKNGRGFWNELGNSGVRIAWTEEVGSSITSVQVSDHQRVATYLLWPAGPTEGEW